MDDSLVLVGVDACVLIEAARLGKNHPSAFLLKAAASQVFRLLLVAQAEREARKVIGDDLDRLLRGCLIERYPDPPAEDVKAAYPIICSRMKHGNDVPLAVAVKTAQPDFFVSSNTDHWKPSISNVLDGVPVMTPRRVLEELGVPVPPKPKPLPRGGSAHSSGSEE